MQETRKIGETHQYQAIKESGFRELYMRYNMTEDLEKEVDVKLTEGR